jgi:hypothetical protein
MRVMSLGGEAGGVRLLSRGIIGSDRAASYLTAVYDALA